MNGIGIINLKKLATVPDSLTAASFATTIRKATQVLDQSAEIMTKINNGEGTFRKLVNNEQFYTNLDQTSKALDELLNDLKSNLKRYVHFCGFEKNNARTPITTYPLLNRDKNH
jgi:phospholipid/cholesterol/gamma-HCH transport system substrate-binding protein